MVKIFPFVTSSGREYRLGGMMSTGGRITQRDLTKSGGEETGAKATISRRFTQTREQQSAERMGQSVKTFNRRFSQIIAD